MDPELFLGKRWARETEEQLARDLGERYGTAAPRVANVKITFASKRGQTTLTLDALLETAAGQLVTAQGSSPDTGDRAPAYQALLEDCHRVLPLRPGMDALHHHRRHRVRDRGASHRTCDPPPRAG
jgi:predicted flavoprotein YhiN